MNTKELKQLTNMIMRLDIPETRKHLDVQTIRWLLRSKPDIDQKLKSLLTTWLRENDTE